MKHKLLLLVLAFLLLAAAPVSAQGVKLNVSGSATSSPAKVRANATGSVEMKKASSTERRLELQLDIVKKKANQTLTVMNGVVSKLENIAMRLESRIAKVKAEGGVVLESENFLAEAKKHITMAKDKIALFVSVDFSTGTLRENFDKLKLAAKEVKLHIKETHTNLMMSVRALKPGSANATSTTSVNASTTNQ